MKTIVFPKYTREENLNCKLTDGQIKEIQKRHKSGESYHSIAKSFPVTAQAIAYWCLPDEVRREKNHQQWLKFHRHGGADAEWHREYQKRKLELHPEFSEYRIASEMRYRKNNPKKWKETHQKSDAKNYQEHREEHLKRNREYYLKHSDKLRAYSKKYYRENKEKISAYGKKHFREVVLKNPNSWYNIIIKENRNVKEKNN